MREMMSFGSTEEISSSRKRGGRSARHEQPKTQDCRPLRLDPATWVAIFSALASAGGAYQQNRAQSKDKRARASAMAAEAQRQEMLGRESEAAVAATAQKLSREDSDAAQLDLTNKYEEAIAPTGPALMADPMQYDVGASAPSEIRSEIGRSVFDALKKNKDYARRTAALGALRGGELSQNIALGRSAQDLNRIGGHQARSTNLLGGELNAANRAGNAARTRADIYGGVSDIAQQYAMTRRPKGGKSPYQG